MTVPLFYKYVTILTLQTSASFHMNPQAENILYKVYRRTLGLKSQLFETMLTLPIGAANVGGMDGTSDATALPLVHTTAEVDALFYFIFNEHE